MRKKLLDRLRQRPFQPILLRLSNNITHLIRHSDQALVTPSYVDIGIPIRDTPGPEVTSTVTLSLIHIVQIDTIETPAASGTNGAAQ